MCGSGEKMLDEAPSSSSVRALACLHTNDAFAATSLCTKRAHGRALDKAPSVMLMMQALVRDEVFHIDLRLQQERFPSGAENHICSANFAQFLFDNREDALLFGEDILQILDGLDKLLVFPCRSCLARGPVNWITAEVENFVGLLLAECIPPIGQARRHCESECRFVPPDVS